MPLRTLSYVRYLFAVLSLAVLFHFVPLRDIVAAFHHIHLQWFLIAVAVQFLTRVVGTFRMKVVAVNQGIAVSLPQLYRLLLAAHFYSTILPGPLVGGGASWVKYRQHGAGTHAAAATVLINRVVGLSMMVTLGICAWVLDRMGEHPVLGGGCILAALVAFAILVLTPPSDGVKDRQQAESTIGRFFTETLRRLDLFRQVSRAGKTVILASALVQELLGTFVILSFAYSVGAQVDFLTVIWLRAALSLVLLLPVTIAGLGLREASLVGLSTLIGVDAVTAVTWSFAILAGTLIMAAVGGLIEANAATGGVARYLGESYSRDRTKRGET